MKGTKFTKGEWIADNNTVYSLHDVPWGNGTIKSNRFYASIYGDASNVKPEELKQELKANAKLIAAAPDLLRSLTFLLERYESIALSGDAGWWNPDDEEVVISAKSAIKKATS